MNALTSREVESHIKCARRNVRYLHAAALTLILLLLLILSSRKNDELERCSEGLVHLIQIRSLVANGEIRYYA